MSVSHWCKGFIIFLCVAVTASCGNNDENENSLDKPEIKQSFTSSFKSSLKIADLNGVTAEFTSSSQKLLKSSDQQPYTIKTIFPFENLIFIFQDDKSIIEVGYDSFKDLFTSVSIKDKNNEQNKYYCASEHYGYSIFNTVHCENFNFNFNKETGDLTLIFKQTKVFKDQFSDVNESRVLDGELSGHLSNSYQKANGYPELKAKTIKINGQNTAYTFSFFDGPGSNYSIVLQNSFDGLVVFNTIIDIPAGDSQIQFLQAIFSYPPEAENRCAAKIYQSNIEDKTITKEITKSWVSVNFNHSLLYKSEGSDCLKAPNQIEFDGKIEFPVDSNVYSITNVFKHLPDSIIERSKAYLQLINHDSQQLDNNQLYVYLTDQKISKIEYKTTFQLPNSNQNYEVFYQCLAEKCKHMDLDLKNYTVNFNDTELKQVGVLDEMLNESIKLNGKFGYRLN